MGSATAKKNKRKKADRRVAQLKKPTASLIDVPHGDFIVDRSRLIAYQRCPRQGWWEYGYEGRGLSPLQESVYLLRGDAIHVGVASLLSDGNLNFASKLALNRFEERARAGMEIEAGEENPPSIDEEKRIITGALTAYYLTTLLRIKGEYAVRDIEREEAVSLGDGVTLLARTDALLEHRIDHTLHIWSLKTTKQYDTRKEKDATTDVQGLSEALAVEARVGKKITSIQMCWLVMGKRKIIEGDSGERSVITQSPYAWGYRRATGGLGSGFEYFASQYWKCTEPHITTHTKKASQCPGNKTHKINDDFELFPTDEYPGGVVGWVGNIYAHQILPGGSAIDELIILPSPYYRQSRDIETFKRQAYWQAKQIQDGMDVVNDPILKKGIMPSGISAVENALDIHFRQHRSSCHYPGECAFLKLCFPAPEDVQKVLTNPLQFGYKWRTPNHPAENTVLKGRA